MPLSVAFRLCLSHFITKGIYLMNFLAGGSHVITPEVFLENVKEVGGGEADEE